ncbi:tetratricopeptide repeat protein [candidate division WOR-3 bacterium]|nr:tetratricopeptide repeat protein [candidate division WOR-3 bacterium]
MSGRVPVSLMSRNTPAGGPRPRAAGSERSGAWFLAIAGSALVVRSVYLAQARSQDPLFFAPQMDSLYHHQWALAVAAGREFIADAFFRAPLYPYFLGLVYRLLGPDLFAVRIVQAIIGSLSAGFTYLLARRVLTWKRLDSTANRSAARVAGFTFAAYPLAIYFDGELLIAGLLVFLLLVGLWLLVRCHDLDRRWYLPGLLFGLAALARPNVLAFLAVLPVWLYLEYRRRAWSRLAWVWGAAALVILPVTLRNYVVSRTFVPIAWQAGTNFYIGNNPNSDGVTAVLPGTRGTWWGGYSDVKLAAERSLGRPLKGAEIDRYWLSQGLEFWRSQTGRALALFGRKLFLWLSGFEVSNNRDLYFFKRYTVLNLMLFNLPLLKFPFGIVMPLALVGAWLARRAWRRLLPLYLFAGSLSISFIAFFVADRFRMPVVPIAIILASSAGFELFRIKGRRLIFASLGLLAAFLLLNANIAGAGRHAPEAQSHFAAAVGLHAQGRVEAALTELVQALRDDSATNVLSLEVTIRLSLRQTDLAEDAARAAARLHPNEADAISLLGNVLAETGRLDSAETLFRQALTLDPYSIQAWNSLGNVAMTQSNLAAARHCYEQALSINPAFPVALFHLGLIDYFEGDRSRAHARWREVLKLDPTHERARAALEQLR